MSNENVIFRVLPFNPAILDRGYYFRTAKEAEAFLIVRETEQQEEGEWMIREIDLFSEEVLDPRRVNLTVDLFDRYIELADLAGELDAPNFWPSAESDALQRRSHFMAHVKSMSNAEKRELIEKRERAAQFVTLSKMTLREAINQMREEGSPSACRVSRRHFG